MDINTFQNLSTPDIAQLIRVNGPKVCVFIINGTRRWFLLEHGQPTEDFALAYFEATSKRFVEICKLLFEHGLDTLLVPSLNPHLMKRGHRYSKMMAQALTQLTKHPRLLDLYDAHKVRVRFYGDHRQCFTNTSYAHLSNLFDQLTAKTLTYNRHRLFFGVCAHDATETLVDLTIRYYLERGKAPDKRTLTEMYYGEYIPPADIFISSGKLHTSDMPLMTTGTEQLYFSVAPSLYLSQTQLRNILYDYLYTRRKERSDYEAMQPKDWAELRQFYQANLDKTLGIGAKREPWDMWYPLPQVILSERYKDTAT